MPCHTITFLLLFLASLGRQDSSVISRQQALNECYAKLLQRAAERRKRLEDAIRQFRMFRDCDELESWIKEKEVVMKAEEKSTGKERVEAMHKKFEVSRASVWMWLCTQVFPNIYPYAYSICIRTYVCMRAAHLFTTCNTHTCIMLMYSRLVSPDIPIVHYLHTKLQLLAVNGQRCDGKCLLPFHELLR